MKSLILADVLANSIPDETSGGLFQSNTTTNYLMCLHSSFLKYFCHHANPRLSCTEQIWCL